MAAQTRANEDYWPDLTSQSIVILLHKLKNHAKSVEQRLPMLSYKTDDDINQLKRFI